MKHKLCRTFFSVGIDFVQVKWIFCLLLMVAPVAFPCLCKAQSEKPLPKVLMIEIQGETPDGPGLYKAIRAQLSASPLTMDRLALEGGQIGAPDMLRSASKLATEHQAAMVFWIEDNVTCTMYFYIFDSSGGRMDHRVLNLAASTQASRNEVIANAASSMIEALLSSHQLKAVPFAPNKTTVQAPAKIKEEQRHKRVELFAVYAGSVFAPKLVTHGVKMGLGLFPTNRLALGASYTQNTPLSLETQDLALTIFQRNLEVSTAARLLLKPIEIRLGLAGSVDLRSYSTKSNSKSVSAQPDDFKAVYSLVPFISAAWVLYDRIGIVSTVGANFAINDSVYKFEKLDGEEEVVVPFIAKFIYQLGLVVQL